MEAKFSTVVQDIVRISRDIILETKTEYVEPEHLLLAIIIQFRESAVKNDACIIIEKMGVDLNELATTINFHLNGLRKSEIKEDFVVFLSDAKRGIPLSKAAEKVLKATYVEARIFNSDIIGSIHLLLSYLRTEVVHNILDAEFNLSYEKVKSFITENKIINSESAPESRPFREAIELDIERSNPRQKEPDFIIRPTKDGAIFEAVDKAAAKSTDNVELEKILKRLRTPAAPLSFIFNKDEYSDKQIKEIIELLSELYFSIGGDYLKIVGMSQFECKIELA